VSTRPRWVFLVATGLALAGLVAAWALWWSPAAPPPALLRTDDAQLLERGRQVYVAQCASCLQTKGRGFESCQPRQNFVSGSTG